MKKSTHNLAFAVAAAFLAALLFFPEIANGQAGTSPAGPVNNSVTSMDGRQAQTDMTEKYLRQELGDPKEEASYQAFHKADEDGDKKIHLGIAFLAKYASDR